MSTGGGGGNILRSLKTLFARDVAIAQKTDARTPNGSGAPSPRGFSIPTSSHWRKYLWKNGSCLAEPRRTVSGRGTTPPLQRAPWKKAATRS